MERLMADNQKRTRILAVSSGGGHWIQLLRLRPAFEDKEVVFASVGTSAAEDVAPAAYHAIPDANRAQKLKLIGLLVKLGWLVLRVRPDVVISTGAAPGYFAVRIGRMLGARTLFLDSIANAEELSLSGNLARRHCDLVLTQWPDLAERDGPHYRGSVL
jgi:UDP-N-acetylglucosamine:LPS N-acetylglucosamine transferase